MSYFLVTAKCGHVGKRFYYKGNFYVEAENGRIAAKVVRDIPRVKHNHKDAILSVNKINYQDFIIGQQEEDKNPYYRCNSKQEQNIYWDIIIKNICEDCHHEQKKQKYKKHHSLKNIYNDDPLYYQYKNNPKFY